MNKEGFRVSLGKLNIRIRLKFSFILWYKTIESIQGGDRWIVEELSAF
jgi:hypothetical protein